MKECKNMKIIGIDHGYGNMKTANSCFPTGVIASDKEPMFKDNLLIWNGKYYQIGIGHKEFTPEKMLDEDYYVLTLAAIARELNIAKTYTADVFIAAGLPLTWVNEQKEDFKNYLLQHEEVEFTFRGKDYQIRIVGAEIYPQGFAAVVNNLADFSGVNMLCDIGNGTMNLMRVHHMEPPEELITRVLRFGTAEIDSGYLQTITDTAREYVAEIFRRLREHGYDPRLMKLYVVGGGGCLIRNFADFDESRVTVNEDICATAKGYERMLEMKLLRGGRL